MDKNELKRQHQICALTGAPLPKNPELIDAGRILERFRGGIYTTDNTRVVMPRAHMEHHGILREREEWLEELKSIMDDRFQTMKIVNKINNQLLAYERRVDHGRASTKEFLDEQHKSAKKRLDKIDSEATKHIKASKDPLVISARGVIGLGEITIAGLQVYVDLNKARCASSLWSYVGLDKASHERYTKGEAGGGNKTLRTILWNTANSMMKNQNCPYRSVYDREKARLSVSEKITKTRNTQGQLIECAWKYTKPSHRHGAALRKMMKHLLADYWFVGRGLAGLDTRPLYAEEYLGHSGIIRPRDQGWN